MNPSSCLCRFSMWGPSSSTASGTDAGVSTWAFSYTDSSWSSTDDWDIWSGAGVSSKTKTSNLAVQIMQEEIVCFYYREYVTILRCIVYICSPKVLEDSQVFWEHTMYYIIQSGLGCYHNKLITWSLDF